MCIMLVHDLHGWVLFAGIACIVWILDPAKGLHATRCDHLDRGWKPLSLCMPLHGLRINSNKIHCQ